MAKSKRKTSKSAAGVSTKKKRDDTSNAQNSGPSFDDLCDNTLLRILSYTDDLRSLISLTRCTTKSLRKRFDLKGDKNTPEYSKLYKKFWQGVFADLQMTPLEESDSKSQDYIAAINYRLTLFNNLIGHDKRKKAGTNRSYSLPLCHHNFKAFDYPWYYGDDDDIDEEETQDTMSDPFALMSQGTGQEYVVVDPDLASVDVHNNIMERVQCLHKSTQKKREGAQQWEKARQSLIRSAARLKEDDDVSNASSDDLALSEIMPSQVLLNSYRHSADQSIVKSRAQTLSSETEEDDLERKWEEYFGDNTPFGPHDAPPHEDDIRMVIEGFSIETFDAIDNDRIVLQEKRIVVCRSVWDQDGKICNEFIVWGDSGCKERSPSKRFELKTILRIPGRVYMNAVSANGDKVYAVLDLDEDENVYGLQTGHDRRVYQFSLSRPNVNDEQYYVQPEFYFSVSADEATAIHPIGLNHVLVGTDVGTIELWDCSNKSAPKQIKILEAFYTNVVMDDDVNPNKIISLLSVGHGRSHNMFFSSQRKGPKGVITLWQAPYLSGVLEEAEFRMMVRIKYEGYINFACNGHSLMVLAHDKFGSLYLDVYHLPGSRYVLNDFDYVSLPKGVEFDATSIYNRDPSDFYTLPDSGATQHLKFGNRINIRHRADIDEYGMLKHFAVDMNDRFIIIEAHDGIVGSNGESKSDGPGLIVIDLDEHAD